MTVQLHTLSNGFRVVTEHMPGLQSASLGIWVLAGSRHEQVEQNGIAHFLEHMAFKGTKTRSSLQIAEALENVGGYMNAYTSRESTAYYCRVLAEDVPLAVDVMSDIVLNSVFDPAEIEVERGVILSEIGMSLDTPDDIVFDWLQEAAYPSQSFGRTILGPSERVKAFTRDDFAQFVGQHYGPDQLVLSAAGAVDHDTLVAEAEARFGHLPARDKTGFQAAAFQGGEHRVVKDLEQAHFTLALEGPDYRDPQIFAAQIYASVMGGGMSSRLFQEVREKKGLCYSIFTQASAFADTGMLTLYAGTNADQLSDLTSITIDELKRATQDMTETEVSRARAQMKAGMLMGLESPSNRAERLARMIAVWGRVPDLSEVVERIDAVSVADVKAYAEHLVQNAGSAMALYGPVDAAPSLEELRGRLAA